LAYYTIYVYSFCQIVFSKTINFCVPYINLAVKRIFNAISKPTIELKPDVKEPEVTTSRKIDTDDDNLVLIKSPTNDVIILDKVPGTLDNLEYEVSDVRFLAIYLKLNVSNSHIIELFNNEENYYVVGNKLDSKFFKYYLHNVLNVKVDNDSPFEYKLEIMDHNVNMIYVDEKQSIVIQKDSYDISLIKEEVESEAISEAKETETKEEALLVEAKEEKSEAKETDALEVESKSEAKEAKEAKSESIEVEEATDNGLDASTIYY
jgi:hypothetical protein